MKRKLALVPRPQQDRPHAPAPVPEKHGESITPDLTPLINRWIMEHLPASARTSNTYADAYLRILPALNHLGGPAEIDRDDVLAIVAHLAEKYSDRTINLTVAAMSSLWQHLAAHGAVTDNPWRGFQWRRAKDTLAERLLTEAETRALIKAAGPVRYQTLLRFLYATGARVSEAAGLRWRDLRPDREQGTVTCTLFGKGRRTRAVLVPLPVYEALTALPGGHRPEDPIFAGYGGQPVSRQRVWQLVRGAARKAGLAKPVSPHWLRHAHATHALHHGAPVNVVQQTLGHANLATTQIYTKALPGESSSLYIPEV